MLCVASAQERLPMIPADKLSDAQKKAVAEMQGGSFGVGGPFLALLREPKLAEQAVAMVLNVARTPVFPANAQVPQLPALLK
jgi:hypothetical protein